MLTLNTLIDSSPAAMSDAVLFSADGPFASSNADFLQMPGVHTRQRSSSEPNLVSGFHGNAPTNLTFPPEFSAQFLPQQSVFMSPTSDTTPTSGTQQHMLPPVSAPTGVRLRRATSMTGRAQAHRHTVAHPPSVEYLSPEYALAPSHGVVRSRSLGSSRSTSPYSRSTSPSGSEFSDAASMHSHGGGADAHAAGIAKQVVTTGPVAEASAIRRTHAAKFVCEICGVALTTKTNLEGHRKSHLGLKEHKCSLCDKSFTRDWDRKRHEKTHAKAELHCNVCGKTSSRKDAFDKHREFL
jgi:uncharacterized Zn-finger protein